MMVTLKDRKVLTIRQFQEDAGLSPSFFIDTGYLDEENGNPEMFPVLMILLLY